MLYGLETFPVQNWWLPYWTTMNYIPHCWSSCQQREGIGCHATSYMNVLCDDRGTCPWEFSSYAWYMCHNSLWLYAALMGVGLITNFHWKTPSRTKYLATCSGPSTLFICGLVSLYSISEDLLWTLIDIKPYVCPRIYPTKGSFQGFWRAPSYM